MANLTKQLKAVFLKISNTHKAIEKKIKESSDSSKTGFDNKLYQEISLKFEELQEYDKKIFQFLDNNDFSYCVEMIKKNLNGIKRLLVDNANKISRDVMKVSMILLEYKERCRTSMLEFLKTLDLDLRKALKPLVPNQVLQEQLKYKPINPDPALMSSMNSNTAEEEKPSENTVDKLNNHIQLLINTLEGVAKDLINITQATSLKYYELVDPLILYSEPPSPLAAPLPDYFSYDLGNISEENRDYYKAPMVISESTKKRLLDKFKMIKNGNDNSCNPEVASKIQEKLLVLFKNDVKEINLMELFKEEGMPMSEREKVVFEMINTDRTKGRDVSLEEIIHANELDGNNPNFEVSRNNYSQILKNIQGKDLTDRFEDPEQFSSLQSSIDEKFIKMPSRVSFKDKKSSLLPPISLVRTKSKRQVRAESKPSLKDIKLRSSTPRKLVNKSHAKRSHTPGLKKKKKT